MVGLIESLSDKELAFELEGARRSIPRDKLLAVVMAQAQADDPRTVATVSLVNGSTASGELASLSAESLLLNLPSGAELILPTSAISSVALRSSRVAFLSDLKPVEVLEQPVVTLGRPWQKNRSVGGRPLTLAGRVFESGLGVHARSQMTFANDGNFDVLTGVIGIDAETAGRGDCVFIVLGDGQPLFTQRVKGTDPPRDVRVDIGRYKQVTLLVEPGEDLDLADHADWCDIRFIKNRHDRLLCRDSARPSLRAPYILPSVFAIALLLSNQALAAETADSANSISPADLALVKTAEACARADDRVRLWCGRRGLRQRSRRRRLGRAVSIRPALR